MPRISGHEQWNAQAENGTIQTFAETGLFERAEWGPIRRGGRVGSDPPRRPSGVRSAEGPSGVRSAERAEWGPIRRDDEPELATVEDAFAQFARRAEPARLLADAVREDIRAGSQSAPNVSRSSSRSRPHPSPLRPP